MSVIDISRNFYVKLDNIIVSDDKKGYKLIQASSGTELAKKAAERFHLPLHRIELYTAHSSSQIRLQRLDQLEMIPEEYEFVLLKVRC